MIPAPYVSAMVQVWYHGGWRAGVVTAVHVSSPNGWRDPIDVSIFHESGGVTPRRMVERTRHDATLTKVDECQWRWAPESAR